MKPYVLKTQHCANLSEIHQEISSLFHFADFYGSNLDALYDFISGEIDLPAILIWDDYLITLKKIGPQLKEVWQVFEDFAQEDESFTFEAR